ncbi:UV-stimulated scaffold protein A homolog [Dendrobium catenatum]|uniref:UV-stimulated scaffold protein A like n=1 Tax=Dendrobium catenatum TaxID=906689 RepID=A0A2I0V9L7_9ASPA|nr:UV-stimulated scaffold protein A homolog [Dendrobium catenatum]PKU60099.1 UV-stimulated scaffold protein A like [Dendrobium catenatum]
MSTEMEFEKPPPGAVTTPLLIEKAMNSTAQEVDPRILKAIKSAARFSDEEIRAAVDALMDQMKKPHSQVRYLAVLIIDELFMRSKLFRSLFVVNLDQFLSLSVGFRKNLPLPPPSAIATNLRSKSIELLEKWNASFGIHYKQLRLGFDYLKDTLRYQFPNRLENAARLQQERRERHLRTMQILLNKFEYLKENFTSIKFDIQSTVDEIGECLEIANAKEENAFEFPVDGDEVEELNSLTLRQIRLESLREGEKVQENSENKAIFDALRESHKLLITKHLSSVKEWISILVRVDATDNKFRDTALKEFIDLRNLIQSLEKKCTDLGIVLDPSIAQKEDEDLWEEGKIEDYKPECTTASTSTTEDFFTKPANQKNENTASVESETSAGNFVSSITDREKLLAEAPVLTWSPFMLDKCAAQSGVLANQRGLEIEGHWGRVDPDAMIPAEKIAELNFHCTVYKEQPVEIRPCLAPLKKGGLCQRRDLKVCPFHGPIIPRDNNGNPIEQGLKTVVSDSQPSQEVGEELTGKESFTEAIYLKTEQADLQDSRCPGKEVIEKLAKQAVKNVHERDREAKALKRAKLAKIRKHNEEVLRDSAIASTSYSELFAEHSVEALRDNGAGVKVKKTTLASMLKKKVTAKDRIARRLLGSRATDASSRQVTLGEDSKYREAFPNQW